MVQKLTFPLDDATVARLRQTAERPGIAKSQVVCEAIQDYSVRAGRLSEAERLRLLKTFDDLVPRIPRRPPREVETELEQIRQARRGGGRRSSRGD